MNRFYNYFNVKLFIMINTTKPLRDLRVLRGKKELNHEGH